MFPTWFLVCPRLVWFGLVEAEAGGGDEALGALGQADKDEVGRGKVEDLYLLTGPDTEVGCAVVRHYRGHLPTQSLQYRSIRGSTTTGYLLTGLHQRNTVHLNYKGLSGLMLIGSTPISSTLQCIPNLTLLCRPVNPYFRLSVFI